MPTARLHARVDPDKGAPVRHTAKNVLQQEGRRRLLLLRGSACPLKAGRGWGVLLLDLRPEGHTTPWFVRRVLACLSSSSHHLQGCSGQPWLGQLLLGGRVQPRQHPSQSACLWQYSLGSVSQHTIAVSVRWLRRHRTHFVGCQPRQDANGC